MERSSGKIFTGLLALAVTLTISLALLPTAVLAIEFAYSQIAVPEAAITQANGINNLGNIVGTYHDAKGVHGFLYTGGSFTPIDVPGAYATYATGINDSGDIVGYYVDNADGTGEHGFLYVGSSFTSIDTGRYGNTHAYGINNSGDIVGEFRAAGSYPYAGLFGFLDVGGSFASIIPLNNLYAETAAYGINNSGNIVGYYDNYTKYYGYLDTGGSFTLIDAPASGGTLAHGINNSGDIVGYYEGGGGYHGFLYTRGSFTPIDVPGATYTSAYGINDSGKIVGWCYGVMGNYGFVATPIQPVSIDIKPDRINPKSKGKIQVAILSTNGFDAPEMVAIESLTFGPTGSEDSLAFCHGAEDVNGDGLMDLVCHFYTQDTGFQCGDTEGILKGKAVEGTPIEGSDSVSIVHCK